MKTHKLKIEKKWWDRLANGEKTYEIRKHDRDYQAGDQITFIETEMSYGNPVEIELSPSFTITHVLPRHLFEEALDPGYCVLSLAPTNNN